MNKQIPISFPIHSSYSASDFMPLSCNEQAMIWIDKYPDWPYPAIIIYGEKGSGKTHLLNLWNQQSSTGDVFIDDVDKIFGDDELEKELFHQFNQAKENNTYILMSMSNIGSLDDIQLADLKSRMNAAPKVEILPPNDDDIRTIFVKLFHDRQLQIEPGVIAYILPRIERSFQTVHRLVAKIDEAALSEKRAVTVPLVREVLANP